MPSPEALNAIMRDVYGQYIVEQINRPSFLQGLLYGENDGVIGTWLGIPREEVKHEAQDDQDDSEEDW